MKIEDIGDGLMRCSRVRKRLSAYMDGELSDQWRERIEHHLAACTRCQEELARLGIADRLLLDAPEVRVPPFLASRIVARAREEVEQGVAVPWWLPAGSPRLGYAMASVVLAGGIILGLQMGRGLAPIVASGESGSTIEILDLGSFRDEPEGSISAVVMGLIEEEQS